MFSSARYWKPPSWKAEKKAKIFFFLLAQELTLKQGSFTQLKNLIPGVLSAEVSERKRMLETMP